MNNSTRKAPTERKGFVVHGHDDAAKEAVARYLERIGFEAIILHEQINSGGTIIEKFEAHSIKAGFAVILLTPDDEAHAADGVSTVKRARQNIILEWGYFIGALGRERVCALKKGDIDLPLELSGNRSMITAHGKQSSRRSSKGRAMISIGRRPSLR